VAAPEVAVVESDPNFPSGPWTGFFLQWWMPGRHMMAIDLMFENGQLRATGSDPVGAFTFEGDYDLADSKCRWVKQYLGGHRVTYSGVNQGQGIWGVWEIRLGFGLYTDQGVFHIWPQGMTPSEEAQATVQAYLAHLRTGWLKRIFGLLLAPCLFIGIVLIMLYYFWGGGSGVSAR
jgi:hypothetical protein